MKSNVPPVQLSHAKQFAANVIISFSLLAACERSTPIAGGGAEIGAVKEQRSFICTPVKLWEGDGPIHCAEGPKVRLAGIAAREIDGTCREGHPCPAADGVAARNYLAGLLSPDIQAGNWRHRGIC